MHSIDKQMAYIYISMCIISRRWQLGEFAVVSIKLLSQQKRKRKKKRKTRKLATRLIEQGGGALSSVVGCRIGLSWGAGCVDLGDSAR